MRKVLLVVMLMLLVIVPVFAQDEPLPTLADLIASRDDLSTFNTVAETLGMTSALAESTTYATLFVPNNDAFAAFMEESSLTEVSELVETMTPVGTAIVLGAHWAPGYLTSTALLGLDEANEEAYWLATITPGSFLSIQDGMINESISLVETDLLASNGVIHVIDTVIVPPSEVLSAAVKILGGEGSEELNAARAEAGTIPEVAAEAGIFTILSAAIEAAGATDLLATTTYTVFAPTDDAFAAQLEAMGVTAEDVLADTDGVTALLANHMVAGTFPAGLLAGMNGVYLGTLVQDSTLFVSVEDDVISVDGIPVSTANVPAKNGIIHVIDGVLVPAAAEE